MANRHLLSFPELGLWLCICALKYGLPFHLSNFGIVFTQHAVLIVLVRDACSQNAQAAKAAAVEVVPKFPIRDKRTVEEVQAEIMREKRARHVADPGPSDGSQESHQ